jgi:hypothetical protein
VPAAVTYDRSWPGGCGNRASFLAPTPRRLPTEALEAEAEHVAVCTGRARSLAVRTI